MNIPRIIRTLAIAALLLPGIARAQSEPSIPESITTPDTVETRIGTLDFTDGAPSAETAEKVYDTMDFTRALERVQQQLPGRVGVCHP